MSAQANREIVTRFLNAMVENDLETVLQTLSEDVTWHHLNLDGLGETLRGQEQITESLKQQMGLLESDLIQQEVFLSGDRAVVVRRGAPRSKITGESLDVHTAHTFSLSEGKITEVRVFYGPELVSLLCH